MYKLSKSNTVFHFLIYPAMLVFLSATEQHALPVGASPRALLRRGPAGAQRCRGPCAACSPRLGRKFRRDSGGGGDEVTLRGGCEWQRGHGAAIAAAARGTALSPRVPSATAGSNVSPPPGPFFVHSELKGFPRPPLCRAGCLQRAVQTFRDLFCSFK